MVNQAYGTSMEPVGTATLKLSSFTLGSSKDIWVPLDQGKVSIVCLI